MRPGVARGALHLLERHLHKIFVVESA